MLIQVLDISFCSLLSESAFKLLIVFSVCLFVSSRLFPYVASERTQAVTVILNDYDSLFCFFFKKIFEMRVIYGDNNKNLVINYHIW